MVTKNGVKMYSPHNERKSIIAERFITSISKNIFVDKLDDIVNKYNNTNHNTIKMKPADVMSNIYIDSSKEIYHKKCEI